VSTKALIVVKNEDKQTVVTIYKHNDGGPDSLGKTLRDLIRGVHLTEGFTLDDKIPQAYNGMGCFAAYLIGVLKGRDIGNVYISAPDTIGVGEEWYYTIYPTAHGKIGLITEEISWF
jgi:hypothetical protein